MKQDSSQRDVEAKRRADLSINALTARVIGLAIEVHRYLGPGLLEAAYEECLSHELALHAIGFSRQVALPVIYKDVRLECGYRMDIVVAECLVLEIKATERLLPVHDAQLLTYMRLARLPTGLLMNFNNAVLKNGIRRMNLTI